MTGWLGPLSDEDVRVLHELWKELMALKPEGWSIVKGHDDLIVRPRERRSGKFSLTRSPGGAYYVAFYSQQEKGWTIYDPFEHNDDVAGEIMQWMVSIVPE
jgi:hypothetical protein